MARRPHRPKTSLVPGEAAPGLQELYARHRSELVAYARRRVGAGPPDPEDLVQQAFANFAGLVDPQKVRNPGSFLRRAISNLIADHFRDPFARRGPVPAAGRDEEGEDSETGPADELSPEIILLDRERFAQVAAAIRAMPQRQAMFFVLNRFEGMSLTEISKRYGASVATVWRDVEAAVLACQDAMAQGGGDD